MHIAHLSKDKKLRNLVESIPAQTLEQKKYVYLHLCSSIISQQLSTKVAAVIYKRFLELYGNKIPKPQHVIDTPFEKLRSIGLSNAKAGYVVNVCKFFLEEKITDAKLNKMSNEEIIELLTQIKGVGKWTVEMILMFTLGREDVFAVDDLGIQQAMTKLYKLDAGDKKQMKLRMLEIAEKWSPYRTYACRYLWRWKDKVSEL